VRARCLCTGRAIRREDAIVVDHFVPWSRYPHDLGHNLVLTTAAVNARKSDHLPAEDHLERWLERVVPRRRELDAAFVARGWLRGKGEFVPISGRWRRLLEQAHEG
jgi:5-methylcytosine-specific restriction endonuclease McrA